MVAEAPAVTPPESTTAPVDPQGWGGMTPSMPFDAPVSAALERIEHSIGGLLFDDKGKPREILHAGKGRDRTIFEASIKKRPPDAVTIRDYAGEKVSLRGSTSVLGQVSEQAAMVIPADVRAAMQLCEYYWATEGDVRMTIEIPMDLAVRPVQVEHESPEVVAMLTELYGPDMLDLDAVTPDIWICEELYGSAYPLEIWDGHIPDEAAMIAMGRGLKDPPTFAPQQVSCLNPKFVYVGRQPFGGGSYMALSPGDDEGRAFREQVKELRVPPMTYNALSYDIHEHLLWAWNIPLAPNVCMQIRDKAPGFVRYPWPSLMSCFRTLSTRQILEEMIRATIEGTKNQLWAFLLGDPTGLNRPTPDEIKALSATVGGMAGTRTGSLVWGGHLRIEVHSPKVEEGLANEKEQRLTEHFFRQRGISMDIVSGEGTSTGGTGPGTADGLNVKVFVERMNYKRNTINRWLAKLTRKVLLLSGDAALVDLVRTNNLPTVKMGDFGIEQEQDVKNRLAPLYQMGALSPQTLLKRSGFNYEHELANHKSADKEELVPPATFAQAVVSPGGEGETHAKSGGNGGDHGAKRTTTDRGRRTGTGGQRGKSQ